MHHTLVFFTVFSQTSVGVLLFREFIIAPGKPLPLSAGFRKVSLIAAVSILLASLVISFFHPGSPENAIHVLNNIGSSWLSREILFLVLFVISLTGYLFNEINGRWKKREILFPLLSVSSALLLLYSMIRLYMLPSVSAWNNAFTPAGFILTALTCGSAFTCLYSDRLNIESGKILTVMAVSFLFISIITLSISYLALGKSFPILLLTRITLSSLAVMFLAGNISRKSANKTSIRRVIIFMIVVASEIIGRYIFFLSFDKNGL